jgi:MYXO-CTERM domain-containing protein
MTRWAIVVLGLLTTAAAAWGETIRFDDPLAQRQYYVGQLRFNEAWNALYQRPTLGAVTVAVLDSGFETGHVDLGANLVAGMNMVDGGGDIGPVNPHGTATSGLPGARSGNGLGISQAAWTAQVLPLRVSNRRDGAAYLSDLASGIRHAADQGARVINVSYGGVQTGILERAARYAYKRGSVTFMAAGNDGQDHNWANHPHLVAVAAVDENSERAVFSSRGKFVDFAAPGVDVTTLNVGGGYADWSGTSFASPLASSVAALVLMANPDLSPAQVLRILKRTAVDLGEAGRDREYGQGLLDAAAAVALALQTPGKWKPRGTPTPDRNSTDVWRDYRGLIVAEGELVQPQGWLAGYSGGEPASDVPEPGAGLLLLIAAGLALGRPRRRHPRTTDPRHVHRPA